MTQYLLQKGTNRIYVYTEELLNRRAGDMVVVDSESINTRIEATKRLIEEKKAILRMKQGEGVPKDIENGAIALKSLQEELTAINKAIQEDEKEKTPEKEKAPETIKEADEKAFKELIENDKEIKIINAMRKAKSVSDYLESQYGIKREVEDLEKLKDEAIKARTETLRDKFNKK